MPDSEQSERSIFTAFYAADQRYLPPSGFSSFDSSKKMKSWIAWLLFAVICVYQILDVYQTKLLFDLGACEANPLLRWLIDITGTWKVIIVVKWAILLIMGIGIWIIGKEDD